MTPITDVEKALTQARELEDYWINEGWQSLPLEEEVVIKDIFVNVQRPSQNTDPIVLVHIELEEKIFIVPLEDVSSIHINDSLVIGVEDLYPDWQEKVESRIGEGVDVVHRVTFDSKGRKWDRCTYLNPVDDKLRTISNLIVSS